MPGVSKMVCNRAGPGIHARTRNAAENLLLGSLPGRLEPAEDPENQDNGEAGCCESGQLYDEGASIPQRAQKRGSGQRERHDQHGLEPYRSGPDERRGASDADSGQQSRGIQNPAHVLDPGFGHRRQRGARTPSTQTQ